MGKGKKKGHGGSSPGSMAPQDDGAARHLIAGTHLPDVALPSSGGAPVNLARYQEKAIIFVYPWTGSPGKSNPPKWDKIPGAHGSTPEAEGFRDRYAAFQELGFEVFGVSGQSQKAQQGFSLRMGLNYQLLSDKALMFADGLKLPRFKTGGKTYLSRLTLVVRDGVIYRTIYPVYPPGSHAERLLGELSPV